MKRSVFLVSTTLRESFGDVWDRHRVIAPSIHEAMAKATKLDNTPGVVVLSVVYEGNIDA